MQFHRDAGGRRNDHQRYVVTSFLLGLVRGHLSVGAGICANSHSPMLTSGNTSGSAGGSFYIRGSLVPGGPAAVMLASAASYTGSAALAMCALLCCNSVMHAVHAVLAARVAMAWPGSLHWQHRPLTSTSTRQAQKTCSSSFQVGATLTSNCLIRVHTGGPHASHERGVAGISQSIQCFH